MNQDIEPDGTAVKIGPPIQGDKFGLAGHYSIGVRTVENWLAAGIIAGRKFGRKLEFDFAECDRRLMAYKD